MIKYPQIPPRKPVADPSKPRPVNPDMKELFDSLVSIEKQPNIMTQAYFAQFEPLFRKEHNLSRAEIAALTQKYVHGVDFYKETLVVVSNTDQRIVHKIPPLFVPFKSLSPNEENGSLVAANQQLFHHEVPRYGAQAFGKMIDALFAEQRANGPVIEEYKKRYFECVKEFFDRRNGKQIATGEAGVEPTAETLKDGDDISSVIEQTTWEFD